MKKVGILTFQRAVNYGAALQMYALQKKFRELGGDAEIIDYDNKRISKGYKAFKWQSIFHPRALVHMLLNCQCINKRNQKFQEFHQKNMIFSETIQHDSLSSIGDAYDAYITGSDQVWNPAITNDDASYFLDFVTDNKKKYSYAASFGIPQWDNTSSLPLKKLLSQFNHMSVREKTGENIIRTLLPHADNISVNVDPVFLLEQSDWRNFVKIKKRRPYIFIYTVGSPQNVYTFARNLANKKNLEIVNLRYWKTLRDKSKQIGHVIYDASPDEFVSLIANASCVVTNSFHATAFSIIFHKDMYVEMPQGLSSRIRDLFSLLEIPNREMGAAVENINWDIVDNNVAKEREKSLQYLKKILA